MWVYQRTEPGCYTVGHYDPSGRWHAESDWPSGDKAAERVHWLNGGRGTPDDPEDGIDVAAELERAMTTPVKHRPARRAS